MKNFLARYAVVFIAVLLTACGGNELLEQAKGGWLGETTTEPPFSPFGGKQEPVKKFIFIEVGETFVTIGEDKHNCEFETAADGKTLKIINPQERVEDLKFLGAAGQKVSDLSATEKDSIGVVARIVFNGDKMLLSLRGGKPVECRRATKQDYETAVKNEQARLAAENQRREEAAAQEKREQEEKMAREKAEREAQAAREKAEREENARQVAAQKAKIAQIKTGMTRDEVIKILGDDYKMTAGNLKGKYIDCGYVLLAWKLVDEIMPFGRRRDGYVTVTFDPQDKVANFYDSVDEFANAEKIEANLTDEELTRQRREQGTKAAKIKGGMTPDAVLAIFGEDGQKIKWGTNLVALAWKTVGADGFYHAVVFKPTNQTYDDEVKWRMSAAEVAERAIK